MKKYLLFMIIAGFTLTACKKEFSVENGGNVNNPLIVGADCRISKIVSYDSATGLPLVSILHAVRVNPAMIMYKRYFFIPAYLFDYTNNNELYKFITNSCNGHRNIKLD